LTVQYITADATALYIGNKNLKTDCFVMYI